jgi:hypothetical protein
MLSTEAASYFLVLALFSCVIAASALLRHEMLILACIPPVFVALIVGFIMAIYAGDTFGTLPTLIALAVGIPPAWWLARRLAARDLLIVIYLVWAVALVVALVAFGFPDRPAVPPP